MPKQKLIYKILNYLGLDIGSSSIKAALVEIKTGKSLGVVQEPKEEMSMFAQKKWLGRTETTRLTLNISNQESRPKMLL